MTWTINIVAPISEIDEQIDIAVAEAGDDSHPYADQQLDLARRHAKEMAHLAARDYSDAVVTVNITGHGDEEDVSQEANYLQVTVWAPNHADNVKSKAEINEERAIEAGINVQHEVQDDEGNLIEKTASFDPDDPGVITA